MDRGAPCSSATGHSARQPHRRSVDRHRGIRVGHRDAVEQGAHVADVGHRHADPPDLARPARRRVVAVGGQVERDREPGLSLGQVRRYSALECGRGMAGVGGASPTGGRDHGGRYGTDTSDIGTLDSTFGQRHTALQGCASHPKQLPIDPGGDMGGRDDMSRWATRLGVRAVRRVSPDGRDDAGPALGVRDRAQPAGSRIPDRRPDRRRAARGGRPGSDGVGGRGSCAPGSAVPASGPRSGDEDVSPHAGVPADPRPGQRVLRYPAPD